MSWFNTVLQVAEVGLELGQLAQMQGLNEKQKAMLMNQLDESARKALLQAARDELFEVKQAAERAVEVAELQPHVAVAMLAFQRLHLQRINLSPELFSDLNDKEYCARTVRFITDHERQLSAGLAAAERDEAVEMAQMALRVPDYQEYVVLYPEVQKLRHVEQRLDEAGSSRLGASARLIHSGLGRLAVVYLVLMLGAMLLIFASESFFVSLLGLGLTGAVAYFYFKDRGKHRAHQHTRAEVEMLRNQVDWERFAQLETELGHNYEAVTTRLNTMETRLERFFSGMPEPVAVLAAPAGEAAAQKLCPSCQAPVPETAGFCHKCGQRL
jgi:hypothetical protein